MAEFRDFIKRIIVILDDLQIKYVIVGGLAIIISGRVRTTTDLDLIIENDEEKYWRFLDELDQSNFDVMREQAKLVLKEGTNLSIFDDKSFMHIDLKLAKSQEALLALNSSKIVKYYDLDLKIPPVEQILYGKILYLGDLKGISERELLEYNDVLDFIVVFRNKREEIDLDLLRKMVKSARLTDTLNVLLSLAK